MPNMGYCRFTNTLGDLRDCQEHFDDSEEDMAEEEIRAKKKLIALCKDIADSHAEDDEEE